MSFFVPLGTSTPSPETKEALRSREVLHLRVKVLSERPVSIKTATLVGSTLLGRAARVRDTPGTFTGDSISHTRVYTPGLSGGECGERGLCAH